MEFGVVFVSFFYDGTGESESHSEESPAEGENC